MLQDYSWWPIETYAIDTTPPWDMIAAALQNLKQRNSTT